MPKLLILLFFLFPYICIALLKPNNILSQNCILYSNTAWQLTYKQYTVSFSRAFNNTPSIFYSINDYQSSSRFYYQNIQTFVSGVQRSNFVLVVNPVQITTVHLFSICFMAIDDPISFAVLSRSYLNPIVFSGNRANRTVTLRESYNFTNSNVTGTVAIQGFFIQSIIQFYVNAEISSIGNRFFTITVQTFSDCSINRLDLSILFYYNSLGANDYTISMASTYCFRNTTGRDVYSIVLTVDTSVFLFGISGFGGVTRQCYANLGWNSSFITNDTVNIIIKVQNSNLTYLCYNFIQIFALRAYISPLPTPTTVNTTSITRSNSTNITNVTNSTISPIQNPPIQTSQNSQQSKNNPLLMVIIVAIVGTLTLLFLLICLIRQYWLSRYYQKERIKLTKKQLSLASVHELPTINF